MNNIGLAISSNMKIEGVKELLENFDFGDGELHKLAMQGTLAVSAEVRKRIRRNAPVSPEPVWVGYGDKQKKMPGSLKKAFKNKAKRAWPTLLRADVWVNKGSTRSDPKGAWYWHFVEHGTKRIDGKEFVQQSLKEVAPEAHRYFREKVLKGAIRAMERRAR